VAAEDSVTRTKGGTRTEGEGDGAMRGAWAMWQGFLFRGMGDGVWAMGSMPGGWSGLKTGCLGGAGAWTGTGAGAGTSAGGGRGVREEGGVRGATCDRFPEQRQCLDSCFFGKARKVPQPSPSNTSRINMNITFFPFATGQRGGSRAIAC